MKGSLKRTAAVLAALMLLAPLAACTAPVLPPVGTGSLSSTIREGAQNFLSTAAVHTAAIRGAGIPAALRSLSVSNETETGGIIGTEGAFTVVTAEATDAGTLEKYLKVTPSADFEITGEGTTFTLRPRTALEANTVYRFRVADPDAPQPSLLTPAAFVFQTEDAPRVTGVFPAHHATDVPSNTGIEFSFSERVSSTADLASFVTLSPAVPFRVELYAHARTLAVIPKEPLPEGETVTATLAAGVPTASGRTLAAGAETTFRVAYTEIERTFTFGYGQRELTVRPGEETQFSYVISCAGEKKEQPTLKPADTAVTVWQYPDAAAAAAALLEYEKHAGDDTVPGREYVFPTDGLTKAGSYTLKTEGSLQSYWGAGEQVNCTVTLPALGAGCYLVSFTASGTADSLDYSFENRQILVQATDISVSTAAAGDDLVVWLQRDGAALAGASVSASLYTRYAGWNLCAPQKGAAEIVTAAATADADGLVRLDTDGRSAALLVIRDGAASRYVCVTNGSVAAETRRVYVYTDRESYFPSDRVSFWGVVTPAAGLTSLSFTSNAADGGRVAVSEDGTFIGSLAYSDFVGYGVSLSFTDADGNAVATVYKSISHEEKPVYTASLSFDKPYYRRGDTVTATLRATFFDGTPAGGLRFRYDTGSFGAGDVTTDADGLATLTLRERSLSAYSTAPVTVWVSCELIGDELSQLMVSSRFLYFHSDRVLEYARREEGVTLTLNELDTSQLKSAEEYYNFTFDRSLLLGAPAEGKISYTLTRSWTERVVTGTYYDPIEKKTRETVRYENRSETLDSGSAAFRDGRIVLPYVREPIEGSNYRYEMTFSENGRTYRMTQSAAPYVAPTYDEPVTTETFALTVRRADGSESEAYNGRFTPGEHASFTVTYGGKPYTAGKVLFAAVSPDGIEEAKVTGTYEMTFAGALVPYARLLVLVSDGQKDVAEFTYEITYDYEKLNQLTLTVTPSAEKAVPGETIEAEIAVVGPDGKPVPGAEVLLSLVDEACFALQEQRLDPSTPLAQLISFRPIQSVVNGRFSILDPIRPLFGRYMMKSAYGGMMEAPMSMPTATMAMMDNAAEAEADGGAGENVYVRETFSDNPVFETAVTGPDGRAVVTVKLPDNITTWRLSAVAAVRDAAAASPIDVSMGADTGAVVVTQPFFVTTTVGSVFLDGDDIALSAKVSGVGDFTEATFVAELLDGADKVLAKAEGTAKKFAAAYLNLGKAPAGEYSVRVTARAGQYADAVRQSFTVVDSAILLRVNKVIAPEAVGGIAPSLYPVTLTFFDNSNTLVSHAVGSLLCGRSGRTDAKAAYLAALMICQKLYGATLYEDEITSILAELNAVSGGWGIYSYAESDPALTAKICLLFADQLSFSARTALTEYLSDVVTSAQDAQSVASGLLGLAALGRPVLGDLHFALDHWDEMWGKNAETRDVVRAHLTLAAAYAVMGDSATALALYNEDAARWRRESSGEIYFSDDGTLEDALALTNAALVAASLTQPAEAASLMEYLLARTSAYELYALETAIFAAAYAPDEYVPKTLTYRLGGEEKTVELDGCRPFSLTLNRDRLADFAVVRADEGVAVRAMYWGAPAEADAQSAPNFTVKKSIALCDAARGFYRVTVTISGTTDRNSFYASITDRLPTGSRFVRLEKSEFEGSDKNVYGWIGESGGQMLGSIYVSNYQRPTTAGRVEKSFTGTFTYVIRAYTPGEFIVESAYVVDRALNTFASSERSLVRFVK